MGLKTINSRIPQLIIIITDDFGQSIIKIFLKANESTGSQSN